MNIRIRAPKDFWAGVLFVVLAAVMLVQARSYPMGTMSRMGAGYFPTALLIILALFGVAIAARSLVREGEPLGRFDVRPLIVIAVAVAAFGALLKTLGLAVCVAMMVVIGARAGRDYRIVEVATAALVLAAFSVLVFVHGLGLPIPVWPSL